MKGISTPIVILATVVIVIPIALTVIASAYEPAQQINDTDNVSNGTIECVLDAQKQGTNPELCEDRLPGGGDPREAVPGGVGTDG